MTLELLRAVPLRWLLAAALGFQLLAIVALVERLKAVDLGDGKDAKERRELVVRERRIRAAYGLMIHVALYLLAGELILTFVGLGR